MPKFKILLVDDDRLVLETTRYLLQNSGYAVDSAEDGNEAIEYVRRDPTGYAVVLLDYRMQGLDASSTIVGLRGVAPEIFVLIYSGDSSRDAVHATWQAGAVGFIEKHNSPEALLQVISNWCRKFAATVCVVPKLVQENEKLPSSYGMVGRSEALLQIAGKIEKYRRVTSSVLVLGETGTGKELVARALHANPSSAFVAVNCAAYRGSSDLLESELFGYEKGAFTGAQNEKHGIFEVAKGGIVFLDEIHHLSLTAQAKLLRVIQERKIRRVGGTREYDVSFRLVSAAKPDLLERCEKGEFLTDLYHRISVLNILLPTLRSRPEDIEPLVSYFCEKYEKDTGQRKHFLLRTVKYLEGYDWPGNVRELENSVYQILTDSAGSRIAPEHLDAKFFRPCDQQMPDTYEEFCRRQELVERDYISRVLQASRNKSDAARRMKISPTTLHSVMKRIGLPA